MNGESSENPSERRRALPARPGYESVLIIGAGAGGSIIATEIQDVARWKLHPVAFVDDNPELLGEYVRGVPVLGDTDAVPAIVKREGIEVIVLAIPSASDVRKRRMIDIARSTHCRVLTMPPIGSILSGEARASMLNSIESKDVLGRAVVEPDIDSCMQFVRGRSVLVTGAAGSIGSELSKQIARLQPSLLVLLEIDESRLHDLAMEIQADIPDVAIVQVLTSITDVDRLEKVFAKYRPEIVIHAAAYKHVPAMENQPDLAIETNAIGTRNVVELAAEYRAQRFIMVSTDKAVRPTSVMGASKRLAELEVLSIGQTSDLSVCNVRFGNVLGSRGSVIPTFERQIRAGGPVTITDERMRRYFMTITEAANLIIQAGAYGHRNATYILDMGDPVRIVDLAKRVIELHGLRAGDDIEIIYTGVRQGEKLYEELSLEFEAAHPTLHSKIRMLSDDANRFDPVEFRSQVDALVDADRIAIMRLVDRIDNPSGIPISMGGDDA
ncbi:MAG: polysaccharide biosynthesis protein [Thermomicrobiales bacterium]|nr:polysaccharide biosynthesis protein [Thermomicrobiales bacterium]MCO5219225.1 polysaccharide biosynthesis protein [Thermomicrobiales bacterium]MCO5225056.1 polysaccharide biosynthesis protein [Thermomicrobiales bacterium]MCO5228108.1 polysaccharide biosynthesis protein [Thermomicrobiales bacterium]